MLSIYKTKMKRKEKKKGRKKERTIVRKKNSLTRTHENVRINWKVFKRVENVDNPKRGSKVAETVITDSRATFDLLRKKV